jgi:hypothetical protein
MPESHNSAHTAQVLHNGTGAIMTESTSDASVLGKIESLVHEEQRLYTHGNLDDHGQQRLQQIQVQLDQCWDLLRQRRALREFGDNPDRAAVRPAAVVEKYEQ